jgi:hypothetical protein
MNSGWNLWDMKSHKKVELVDKYKDNRSTCYGGGFSRNGEYLIVGMN